MASLKYTFMRFKYLIAQCAFNSTHIFWQRDARCNLSKASFQHNFTRGIKKTESDEGALASTQLSTEKERFMMMKILSAFA